MIHLRRAWPPTRSKVAILSAIVLAAAFLPGAATASHPEVSLPGSNFEIDADANFVVDDAAPSIDWASVDEERAQDLPTGSTDNAYEGGAKEDDTCPGQVTGTIPNNKSDLRYFGVYEEEGDPGYLHLFWTRVQEPSGATLMDFEFNKSDTACSASSPNRERTEGDLLIEYKIEGGTDTSPDITLRKWTGTAWGEATLIGGNEATGSINLTPIENPLGAADDSDGTLPDGTTSEDRIFGEASIDLGVIFDENKCESFGSAMLKSRAGPPFTSQIKDFIAPIPIELTNCGKVVIHKETDPDEDPNETEFDFAKSFGTDPVTSNNFSLTDDGTATFDNVLFGDNYTVEELLGDDLPDGWDFVDVDCSAGNVTPDSIVGAVVTFDIDDEADVLECTYNNRARGTIVVEKITDDGFGAFEFTSNTLTPSPFTLTTTAAGAGGKDDRTFGDLTPGTYDVAETVPAGWNLVSATCDDGSDPASIGLSAGETVTCTFHDARERGAIKIVKMRKHAADGPGDHPHAGVTFTITGGELAAGGVTAVTNANGVACVDDLVVSSLVGNYSVEETVPAGYKVLSANPQGGIAVTESECGDGNEATVEFDNMPLTNLTVSVDSQVDGGTASTIDCLLASASTGPNGDGSLTLHDLEPGTYTCEVVIDP